MPKHSEISSPNELHYSLLKIFQGVAPNLFQPDFPGQIICQSETGQLYRATGTQPGSLQEIGVNITALNQLLDGLALALTGKVENEDFTGHLADTTNPHETTAAQVGATPISHLTNFENPHQTNPQQIGAVAVSQVGAVSGICPLGADSKVPPEFLPPGSGGGGTGDGNDAAPQYAYIEKAYPYVVTEIESSQLFAWYFDVFKDFSIWFSVELPTGDQRTRSLVFNEVPANLEITLYNESDLTQPALTILWDGLGQFNSAGLFYDGRIFIALRDATAAKRQVNLTIDILVGPPPEG